MSGGRRIRAYTLTGGRAARDEDLFLDQMLVRTDHGAADHTSADHTSTDHTSTEQDAPAADLSGPHAAVFHEVAQPQSLADLSASLGHPVGVLRVICLDLIESGVVERATNGVDRTSPSEDLDLLAEVLERIALL